MRNREIVLKGTKTLGFSLNDAMATIFGQNNVDTIKQQVQASATSLAVNAAGQYVKTNPDAVKAISQTGQDSVMETLDKVWKEYKIPVIAVGAIATLSLAYGIYSMIQMNKTTKALGGAGKK